MANSKASAPISLKKLLAKNRIFIDHLLSLLDGSRETLGILDDQGQVVFGAANAPTAERFAIVHGNQNLGWTYGTQGSPQIAALLSWLADQESEKKSLAMEVLERYRELNLLYNLSENLAASPKPENIAGLTLDQARHLIPCQIALIYLPSQDSSSTGLSTPNDESAQYGYECRLQVTGLIDRVLASGKAELENNVDLREYFPETETGGVPSSLLCAPLKTEKRILGVMALATGGSEAYTAGDLKLLNTIAQQAAPTIEIAHLYQMALEKAQLERELKMALDVQASLLPTQAPQLPGWEFAARWQPARVVSGDYYDYFVEPDGNLGLIIADVTDKGMPAALFMAFSRTALHATLNLSRSPKARIGHANRLICHDSTYGFFVTLAYASVNLESGSLKYVNAGHNPPLVFRHRTCSISKFTRTGIPLGIFDDVQYEQRRVRLATGDLVLFYTDGITEAYHPQFGEFGEERLKEVLKANCQAKPEKILDAIAQAVAEFTEFSEPGDDITMMALKRLPT